MRHLVQMFDRAAARLLSSLISRPATDLYLAGGEATEGQQPMSQSVPISPNFPSALISDEALERAQVDALLTRYGVPEQRIAEFRAPYPS